MGSVVRSFVCTAIVSAVLLAVPAVGYAQEATMSGTVADSTGGVLPGVAITSVHEASGNTFETVTDERGTYRLPLRIGVYRMTATLLGFATSTRTGLEVLVGQQATINVQMAPSTLQETVTVTSEAPLVDVSQTRASGNVDARQMEELPVNGRNWQDLALLAPGVRVNSVTQLRVRARAADPCLLESVSKLQHRPEEYPDGRYERPSAGQPVFATNASGDPRHPLRGSHSKRKCGRCDPPPVNRCDAETVWRSGDQHADPGARQSDGQ